MKIIECEQGTIEWQKARLGMITGTDMDVVVEGSKSAKVKLACELVAEEATEQSKQFKQTAEMERGTAEEVFARKEFEKQSGKKITELGFCISDKHNFVGCSGDGWIGKNKVFTGASEFKSPDSSTKVFYQAVHELGLDVAKADQTFLGIPNKYKWQVINYFFVNENLDELYFGVWDPRFIADKNKLYIVTVKREQIVAELEQMEKAVVEFRELWLQIRELFIEDNF